MERRKIRSYNGFANLITKVVNKYFKKYRQYHTSLIMQQLYKSIIEVREICVVVDMKIFNYIKNKILEKGIGEINETEIK